MRCARACIPLGIRLHIARHCTMSSCWENSSFSSLLVTSGSLVLAFFRSSPLSKLLTESPIPPKLIDVGKPWATTAAPLWLAVDSSEELLEEGAMATDALLSVDLWDASWWCLRLPTTCWVGFCWAFTIRFLNRDFNRLGLRPEAGTSSSFCVICAIWMSVSSTSKRLLELCRYSTSHRFIIFKALYRKRVGHFCACSWYRLRCCSLTSNNGRVCASFAINTLRTCEASPLMRWPPSNPLLITLFKRTIMSLTLFSRARLMMLK